MSDIGANNPFHPNFEGSYREEFFKAVDRIRELEAVSGPTKDTSPLRDMEMMGREAELVERVRELEAILAARHYVESLTGKFLIRRATNSAGKPVLVVAGIALLPEGLEVDERDEMWVGRLLAYDIVRKANVDSAHFSPEDFISNPNICKWKDKNDE